MTFNRNCETETSDMYDIQPLKEGKEKFTSFESLAEWAHGDNGFYENQMVNSKDKEIQKFMLELGLIEEEEDEQVGRSR